MSIKVRYWIFVGILHIVLAFAVYSLLERSKLFFVLGETLLLTSLFFSYSVYKKLIAPLEFIASGVNAIESGDHSVKYLPVGSREMDELIKTFNEMSEHLRLERVRNSERHFFLQKLIEIIPSGIILYDFDGQISSINNRAQEFLKLAAQDLHDPESWLGQLAITTSRVISIAGAKRYKIECSAFVHLGFERKYIMIHDLTHEILKHEKDTYGKIIRMMSHEVNNTIGPVNSIIESTTRYLSERNDAIEYNHSLIVAQNRNKDLSKFMRNFADLVRKPEPQKESIDLVKVLQDVAELWRIQLEERGVRLILKFSDTSVPIEGDAILLRQAFINIVKNALEAIEETGRVDGLIEIRIGNGPATLEFFDNGCGIPDEVRPRLAEPFFSTKDKGQGIGLVLIRDILTKHYASFEFLTESEMTCVKVVFAE